jgi:hypothetical protein
MCQAVPRHLAELTRRCGTTGSLSLLPFRDIKSPELVHTLSQINPITFLSHPTTLRWILILSSSVCLVLSRQPLTSGFQRNTSQPSRACYIVRPIRPSSLNHNYNNLWSTNSKALHYKIFSTFWFFSHRFSSAPCSQTQFVFDTRTKQQTDCILYIRKQQTGRQKGPHWMAVCILGTKSLVKLMNVIF